MVVFGTTWASERIGETGIDCPRCGRRRPATVERSQQRVVLLGIRTARRGEAVDQLRCEVCGLTAAPPTGSKPSAELMAEWNHRVLRLVATVGLAAGHSGPVGRDREYVARAFLVRRGWFHDDIDAVVGWAGTVPRSALQPVIEDLQVALGVVSGFVRIVGMEHLLYGLVSILAAGGGGLGYEDRTLVIECGTAAGLPRERIDEFIRVASGAGRRAHVDVDADRLIA